MRFPSNLAVNLRDRTGGCRCLAAVVALSLALAEDAQAAEPAAATTPYRLIGATATVTEASSGLPFMARVDTGATTCSIHCEAMEIENVSDDAEKNVGKPIRILVKNKKGESQWINAVIADYTVVKTSERSDWRYKVKLGIRWHDVEKQVLFTLNDRAHMSYPVLIGRNFLRNGFLVNVALDGQEAVSKVASVTNAVGGESAAATAPALANTPPADSLAANDAPASPPADQ